jgi:hypothetical protein
VKRLSRLAVALVLAFGLAGAPAVASTPAPDATGQSTPAVGHVFVLVYENEDASATWDRNGAAPYLANTLRDQGVYLDQYFATGHASLDNYISMISGQGPNAQTQADCQVYTNFIRLATFAPQQAVGTGCVYPSSVKTVADQLTAAGKTWRGYMQEMGTPCRHPKLGSQDTTQKAKVGDNYAARHNPFMYFHSIIDNGASCALHVVDLNQLPTDLQSVATTRNLTFITPDLCEDGHDAPCVDGRPGGLTSFNTFLQTWVPQILASPAFQADGMLVITADEGSISPSSSTACCGEGPGPNAPLPGLVGLGGGRVGALVIAAHGVTPGTTSTKPYNHYSLLRSIEDIFHLTHLGYAGLAKQASFGTDVFNGS